jgi:hypothetical protein
MKIKHFLTLFLVVFLFVSAGNLVMADDPIGGGISLTNPLCADDDESCLLSVLGTVIARLLQLAAPAVAIMALIGGFQMLFAGGNPQKFTDGRKTITYAVIGFVVIIMAQGVVGIIQSLFGT